MIHITTNIQDRTVTFILNGRLDTLSVNTLRSAIEEVDFQAVDKAIFDCKALGYVSAVGMREFLVVRKKFQENSQVILMDVSKLVISVLKAAGFDAFLTVVPKEEEPESLIRCSYKMLLARKVMEHPDKIFLAGEDSYTWKEIDIASQIIAEDLRKMGVKKGSHVAVSGANSVNWILTFFAVQKLGAIACLVNFNLGKQELITLSKIGDVTHLCCGEMPAAKDFEEFAKDISGEDSAIDYVYDIRNSVNIKERFDEYMHIPADFAIPVIPDDLAVMIFTSGSTGKPKGVLLSAFNILNASNTHMNSIHQDENDRVCLILPLFHIFGLLSGLFTSVLADSTITIPTSLKMDNILQVLEDEKCTIMHAVPSMMLALVANKNFQTERVSSLRSSILAGAAITEAQLLMLQEKLPSNHFSISYGLSEMAPITVTDYNDTTEHITQTVGKIVNGIKVKIQNPESKEECPAGVSGEILVQGYNLMTCYYKLEIENQSIDDDAWLHTGDLGYMDEDGYLHLSGRLKELIIRGGENIIPNEVASAISEFESIADAKVVGVPDDFYGEQVAAAIIIKEGYQFEEAALREFLKSRLAKFKIPAYIQVYTAFPMLSNGKVDMVNLKKEMSELFGK